MTREQPTLKESGTRARPDASLGEVSEGDLLQLSVVLSSKWL